MRASPGTDRAITRQLGIYGVWTIIASGVSMVGSFLAFLFEEFLGRDLWAPALLSRLALFLAFLALVFFVTWAVRVVRRTVRDGRDRVERVQRAMREGIPPYADTATVSERAEVRKLDPSADPAWLRANGMDHAASVLEYLAEPREVLIPAGATAVVCPLCMKRGTDGGLPDEHLEDPTPDDDALLCPNSNRRWRIIREGNK